MGDATNSSEPPKPTRRGVAAALALGWAALTFCGAMLLMMLQEFLAPKVLREPRRLWRVGKLDQFSQPRTAYEQFKQTPDGSPGFWIVNLRPAENRLVALSTICTHLGCSPNWQAAQTIFKCPCHGSGYDLRGIQFEGPAPRPLERYAIALDDEGYVVVDQSKVFRNELGQWENPESYLPLS